MRRIAALIPLLFLLTGCSDDTDPTPAPMPTDWEVLQGDLPAVITGFWGTNKDSVFAVGGTLPDTEGNPGDAIILWYDGSAWWRMATDAPTLWWAHGFAQDDVWAVGEQGTILHFDGTGWTTVQTGAEYTVYGIWGESPDELWAVGGVLTGSSPSVVLHYDGTAWTEIDGVGQTGEFFFKIWGASTSDIWVVGTAGALVHYDGTDWNRMSDAMGERLVTVSGSASDDVYVVGGLNQPVVLNWDGSAWSPIYVGTNAGMMGVCATSSEVLVTGLYGETSVGTLDNWHPQVQATADDLHGTWCDGQGNLLAGGGKMFELAGNRTGVIVGRGDFVGGDINDWSP